MFGEEHGTPLEPTKLTRYARKALTRANVPASFRPWHGMRHTALTETAAAGVPGMFVQAKAGHAQGSTTEGYLHPHPRNTRTLPSSQMRGCSPRSRDMDERALRKGPRPLLRRRHHHAFGHRPGVLGFPAEVLDFVIDRCVLLSLGDAVNGQTMPGRFLADAEWVLLVDGRLDEHDLPASWPAR